MIMLRKTIIITFCITILFTYSTIAFAQTEDIVKDRVEETSFNCESLRVYYEGIRRMYDDTNNGTPFLPIIMIARLGSNERNNSLNWQRLKVTKEFANRYSMLDVVTAQGKKTKGVGKVEIYYGGILRLVIWAKRNEKFDETCFTQPV